MNYSIVFYMTGRILQIEALLFTLPMVTAVFYRENCFFALLISALIAGAVGFFLLQCLKRRIQ